MSQLITIYLELVHIELKINLPVVAVMAVCLATFDFAGLSH